MSGMMAKPQHQQRCGKRGSSPHGGSTGRSFTTGFILKVLAVTAIVGALLLNTALITVVHINRTAVIDNRVPSHDDDITNDNADNVGMMNIGRDGHIVNFFFNKTCSCLILELHHGNTTPMEKICQKYNCIYHYYIHGGGDDGDSSSSSSSSLWSFGGYLEKGASQQQQPHPQHATKSSSNISRRTNTAANSSNSTVVLSASVPIQTSGNYTALVYLESLGLDASPLALPPDLLFTSLHQNVTSVTTSRRRSNQLGGETTLVYLPNGVASLTASTKSMIPNKDTKQQQQDHPFRFTAKVVTNPRAQLHVNHIHGKASNNADDNHSIINNITTNNNNDVMATTSMKLPHCRYYHDVAEADEDNNNSHKDDARSILVRNNNNSSTSMLQPTRIFWKGLGHAAQPVAENCRLPQPTAHEIFETADQVANVMIREESSNSKPTSLSATSGNTTTRTNSSDAATPPSPSVKVIFIGTSRMKHFLIQAHEWLDLDPTSLSSVAKLNTRSNSSLKSSNHTTHTSSPPRLSVDMWFTRPPVSDNVESILEMKNLSCHNDKDDNTLGEDGSLIILVISYGIWEARVSWHDTVPISPLQFVHDKLRPDVQATLAVLEKQLISCRRRNDKNHRVRIIWAGQMGTQHLKGGNTCSEMAPNVKQPMDVVYTTQFAGLALASQHLRLANQEVYLPLAMERKEPYVPLDLLYQAQCFSTDHIHIWSNPLRQHGVNMIFSSILNVMKQYITEAEKSQH